MRQVGGDVFLTADAIVCDICAVDLREVEEYKVDGAIYWAHIGCRQTCATTRIIKDTLMDQAGVPTLIVDHDLADPTYAPAEQLQDKLDEFFELLEERM